MLCSDIMTEMIEHKICLLTFALNHIVHVHTIQRSTLFLHGVCMLRECIYAECAHEQHVRRTLTLTVTHTITAYSISGNVVLCAYSSLQLDKSRVEKEFTLYNTDEDQSFLAVNREVDHIAHLSLNNALVLGNLREYHHKR